MTTGIHYAILFFGFLVYILYARLFLRVKKMKRRVSYAEFFAASVSFIAFLVMMSRS